MTRRLLIAGSLLGAFLLPAQAQNLQAPSVNQPGSGTITVTNTFQNVLKKSSGIRFGCSIQNQGTHTMYVFAGPNASATEANSKQISAGNTYYCGQPGNSVIQDEINITGTSTDAFQWDSQY